MANLMGILGGVGQGISAGVQDLERMDEAKFRKELQQRERERIAEERRVGEQIKGIQAETPAEYDESMSTITKPAQKLSRAQMLERQAAIYSASPDRANQQLGLQMAQAARAETNAEKLQAIQTGYADTLKAINTDPNKWVQENLAKFNSDEIGGPGTKGFIAAPMSTPQGTVLNLIGPNGQPGPTIPVNKDALTRVAKSMYFDQLASVDPKYAELAMRQEELGIKRLAGETDAQFKARQADYYAGRLALDKTELDARIRGGLLSRAPGRFDALGIGNEGEAIFGIQDGKGVTIPIPKGFSGSFPKLTEKKPRDEVQKAWLDTESALIKNGESPEAIRQQQTAFYARRGVAPPAAEDAILQGYVLDKKGKQKPLTADDVKEFNRRYPKSEVKLEDLPWYKK